VAGLFSEKAKGTAKQLRDGSTDSIADKLKTALAEAKFVIAKNAGVRKMVVFENAKKKKTQFFVVREDGNQVIVEIKLPI
jgi:hypothetical protein